MGDQVTVTPEQLEGLANTIDSSMNKLRTISPGEAPDAGISTGVVAESLATVYQAVAAMVADAEATIVHVRDSGGEYTRSDEQAEAELPPIAIPPNLQGGS